MSETIGKWDLHKLPENILIRFETRKDVINDVLHIVGKAYRVGLAKLDGAKEYVEKENLVTYEYLNDHIHGPVVGVMQVRAEQAHDLTMEQTRSGVDDHVLVHRKDWDDLKKEVTRAKRWTKRWKGLAKSYYQTLQILGDELEV